MTRRLLRAALLILPPALLCAGVRLLPAFAEHWSNAVSRPGLRLMSAIGGRLPFSLLEWGALVLMATLYMELMWNLLLCGLLRACARLLQRVAAAALLMFWLFAALWYPLCFATATRQIAVTATQLSISCQALIDDLSAASLDFSEVPDDLPAKFVAFPSWMQALNLSGLASFPTGEALIAADLPAAAVPFVAVHEAMHLMGHADEGEANIAAWEDCLARGGIYADSARLWALKDSLALLRSADPAAWHAHRAALSPEVYAVLAELGGENSLPSGATKAVFTLLGMEQIVQSYENLALYLAAQMPV